VNPEGVTVEFPLMKDPVSRAYCIACSDGLRSIRKFLDGGLEFVDYKLAPTNGDRSAATSFMRALLLPPTV
jgi:hypothetical protein